MDKEKIYDDFLKHCKNRDLFYVKNYYVNNIGVIKEQLDKIKNYDDLLIASKDNIDTFGWIIRLYKIPLEDLMEYICDAIFEENTDILNLIKKRYSKDEIASIDLDLIILRLADDNNFERINLVLSVGFKIKDMLPEIFREILYYDNIEIGKKLNDEYKYLDNNDNFKYIFLKACGDSCIETVKWLYFMKQNVFFDANDHFNEEAIKETEESGNEEVLSWLVDLFDRYELFQEDINGMDVLFVFDSYAPLDDESENQENELFTYIMENKEHAYELLDIKEKYVNDTNETCLICKDKTSELLKLNCNHYGCVGCLAQWYSNNKEICPYCQKEIIWPNCKRLKN